MELALIFIITMIFFIGVLAICDRCALMIKKCFEWLSGRSRRKRAEMLIDDFSTRENLRENMRAAKSFRKDVDKYGWKK